MRKGMQIILLVFCLCILNACDAEEMRVRIIADDNLPQSIINKGLVRDAFIEVMETYQLSFTSEESLKILKSNLKKLLPLDIYESLTISFQMMTFPSKSTNNKFLPAKTCQTLLIAIGKAQGDNWWSLLYPEYYVKGDDQEIEYRSYLYDYYHQ